MAVPGPFVVFRNAHRTVVRLFVRRGRRGRRGGWCLRCRTRRGGGGVVRLVLGAVGTITDVAAGFLHGLAGALHAALDGLAGLLRATLDLVARAVQVVADGRVVIGRGGRRTGRRGRRVHFVHAVVSTDERQSTDREGGRGDQVQVLLHDDASFLLDLRYQILKTPN